MTHLIPCRFCEMTPEIVTRQRLSGGQHYAVRHDDCRGGWNESAADAAEEWNAENGIPVMEANAPADPALLALAKLGAMIHMEADPELDRAQFVAGTLAKVGNGVGNIPGITLLARALLAPEGAASEGVTDGD